MTRPQEVRHEALLQLYGAGQLALSADHVQKVAKRGGFDYTLQEVKDALFFLEGQELARQLTERSTGEVRYQITSKGMLEWEAKQG